MISGVYKIVCKTSGRFYVGSSKNLNERWNTHLCNLRGNKHINRHLQSSFNKYGEDSFVFETLEECDVDNLFDREQFYIDSLDACSVGFNIGRSSCGGDNISNNPNKNDIVKRIKNKILENLSNMSEEERKLRWSKPGDKNPNYGKRWSDQMRKDASDRNKGRDPINKGKTNSDLLGHEKSVEISTKLSEYASKRVGEKNPFFGKSHTDESKDKIRKSRIGRYHGDQNIKIIIDGTLYNSYSEASRILEIPIVTIRWRCLSKNPKFSNYQLDSSPLIGADDL